MEASVNGSTEPPPLRRSRIARPAHAAPSHGLRVEHTLANKIRSLSGFALGLRSREAVMVHGPRRLGCLKQGLKPSDALRVRVCDRNSSLVCRTVGGWLRSNLYGPTLIPVHTWFDW